MANKARILDDIAQLAGGTVGVLSGASQNIRSDLKSRIDDIADNLDLVPRADFEKLEAMLEQSRIEQEDLKKRIEKLEKK